MVNIDEVLESSEMTLLLSNGIVKRISECKDKELSGLLYGFEWENKVIAVTFLQSKEFRMMEENLTIMESIFPAGIYPIGIFMIGKVSPDPDAIELPNDAMEHISMSLGKETTNNINCVVVLGTDIHHDITSFACNSNNDLKVIKHEYVDMDNLWNDYMLHHITGVLKLTSHPKEKEMSEKLQHLQEQIKSGAPAFFLEKDAFLIRYTTSTDVECSVLNKEVTCDKTVQEISAFLHADESEVINAKHRKNAMDFHHMNWNVKLVATGANASNRTLRSAPVINYYGDTADCLTLPIKLDCLAITHKSTSAESLMKYLCQAVVRQLKVYGYVVKKLFDEGKNISLILPYHFYPELCGHPLTLLYPKEVSEEDLKPWREFFHNVLGLPHDIPCVRRSNQHTFDWHVGNYIKNPHIGLSHPKINGEMALVRGDYSYHHYLQDKIDDNGWGCAYRSLQTLVSWFRFQGYTEKPIPNHREIQECLVSIGDKPQSFIGSRQWIGSTEVSFVLDTMFNVTSRILFVNSGEEMASQGRELLHHFKTQGTPIMIGGGVLAHTILGVDYNCETGEISFLILDPHFTGNEDLITIQKKGFCGWKGVKFWDKSAHYNMCLPLRPTML